MYVDDDPFSAVNTSHYPSSHHRTVVVDQQAKSTKCNPAAAASCCVTSVCSWLQATRNGLIPTLVVGALGVVRKFFNMAVATLILDDMMICVISERSVWCLKRWVDELMHSPLMLQSMQKQAAFIMFTSSWPAQKSNVVEIEDETSPPRCSLSRYFLCCNCLFFCSRSLWRQQAFLKALSLRHIW